ncbi:PLD nuclease N-terminal domain-containing protein [Enterococcus entomosocium]|uniref:PLD nuclease N-terminal domain-containing protein n=1 Tax=Enterococcus entomosocium TaxID=3034352 RepID=UPI0034577462
MNSFSLNVPENISDYLPILIPLILLQLILIVLAVRDILKQEQFKFGSRILWLFIACFVSLIGPILYFAFGKGDRQ